MQNSNTSFKELFEQKATRPKEPVEKLAVKAGRQTLPTDINSMGGLIAALGVSMPDFNFKLLEALETLSLYNPEVSNAVDNITTLGNTAKPFPKITFDDSISANIQKEMINRLKTRSKKWYSYSAGLTSLINDLFGQTALNGALSAEIIPSKSLDGVEKIVLLPPKHVRFKYHDEDGDYRVYQEIQNAIALSTVNGNLLELNPVTYKYITVRRMGEKPYGIPPFLSALENIAISRDMAQNLMYVVKKLGVMGFLEVLIKAPKPSQGETEKEYFTRSETYLNTIVPEIDKGLSKGYVAGFEGNHKFNMHPTTGNVQGARELSDGNDVKLMSGLKQDPLMFGRNFSTTESLARVVLAKMTTQVGNYQNIVASLLEQAFLIDLQLAGYPVTSLEVTFDRPMVGDAFKEQQAREKEIANISSLYTAGIINQTQRAIELGYEKADQEEPRALPVPLGMDDPAGDGKDPAKSEEDTKDVGKNKASFSKVSNMQVISAAIELGSQYAEYPYHTEGCTCPSHDTIASYSTGDKNLDRFISEYLTATKKGYNKAVQQILAKMVKTLTQFTEGGGDQAIVDAVLHLIYREWGSRFTVNQTKIINSFVNTIYTFFRKDSTIFGAKDVPKGAFSTVDFRAVDYYKRSDTFYLGKFITDEDLKKNITAYIKEAYLENRLPIGDNPEGIEKFKKEFGELFAGQEWKLRRIIDTTVAKMRNTAAVSYMQQAEVDEYEIMGVNDRLQCGYCANMQGKKFSVSTAMNAVSNSVISDPAIVGLDSPFITSVYKKPEDMVNLTGAEMQSAGIQYPPFHGHCRDTVVAVL